MTYTILDEHFKTQKALIERIKNILEKYKHGAYRVLSPYDTSFMIEIFERHPNYENKIRGGVRCIFVEKTKFHNEKKDNYCFYIKHDDLTKTDISYRECLRPATKLQKIKNAARKAIEDDTIKFKNDFFKNNPNSDCPVSHVKLLFRDSHVDHQPPCTFDVIVSNFINTYRLNIDDVVLVENSDGMGVVFADQQIIQQWIAYHKTNATLRVLTGSANLSLPKVCGTITTQSARESLMERIRARRVQQ